jgi:prepilin-type N-terminal cleavage/methylation domain-containing protein
MRLRNHGQRTTDNGQRPGFTLVELLVVIAIIAVLVSLLVGASVAVLRKVDEVKAHNDIQQMGVAVNTFKQQMKVPYLPSRIRLREDLTTYSLNDPLDADSLAYLNRVFPKMTGQTVVGQPGRYVDWNGDGTYFNANGISQAWELEGDQCLVFFLGGIQTTGPNAVLGFSSNPADPSLPGADRINGGPFFQFAGDRLFSRGITSPSGLSSGSFFSFQDSFKRNYYAYFSSYKAANGYNRYFDYYFAFPSPNGGAPYQTGFSDCQSLGVWPYASVLGPLPRYQNAETFQIVCAGANGQFGTGTVITNSPTFPAVNYPGQWFGPGPIWDASFPSVSPGGEDDLSNFSAGRLIGG